MKYSKMIVWLGLLMSLLVGCSDSFEDIETFYENREYRHALDTALRKYEDPKIRSDVHQFLEMHGTELIERLIDHGDALSKGEIPSEKEIHYWQYMDHMMQQLQSKQLSLVALNDQHAYVSEQLEGSINRFTRHLNQESMIAFDNNQFRHVIQLVQSIKSYDRIFLGMREREKMAKKLAKRRLVITPAVWNDGIEKSEFGTKKNSQRPIRNRTNVLLSEVFTDSVFEALKKDKSEFLDVSLAITEQSTQDIDYGIDIGIDAYERDTFRTPVYDETRFDTLYYSYYEEGALNWRSTAFSYDIYTVQYKVIWYVTATIYEIATHQSIQTFQFKEAHTHEVRFREDAKNVPLQAVEVDFPETYLDFQVIPRHFDVDSVIERSIQKASNRLSDEILQVIDTEENLVLQ